MKKLLGKDKDAYEPFIYKRGVYGFTARQLSDWFPPMWWEMLEVRMACVPDEALKAFRASIIDRKLKKRRLSASSADNAIAGAEASIRTGPAQAKGKRAIVPEPRQHHLNRQRWYIQHGMYVIFVRPQGYKWQEDELAIISEAREADCPLSFLEFTANGVDRVEGPPVSASYPEAA